MPHFKKYDIDGHIAAAIFLNSDENKIINSDHYTIVKKAYYADGKLRAEIFYDQDDTQPNSETINMDANKKMARRIYNG